MKKQTNHRTGFISTAIEKDLHAYMAKIFKNESCPVLIIGGTENHIHSLCRLERTITVANLVEQVKKGSSKWIKTRGHEYTEFSWQAGYGAFSIGASNINVLTSYICNQKEHHKKITFKDEYRSLLRKYNVFFDERYVWD